MDKANARICIGAARELQTSIPSAARTATKRFLLDRRKRLL